jgi:hypothetical protein
MANYLPPAENRTEGARIAQAELFVLRLCKN